MVCSGRGTHLKIRRIINALQFFLLLLALLVENSNFCIPRLISLGCRLTDKCPTPSGPEGSSGKHKFV